MRRVGIVMLLLALTACDSDTPAPTGPSTVGPIVFSSQLLGSNEVPPVTGAEASGRGVVTMTLAVPRDSSGNVVGAGTATFAMQASGFAPGTPVVGAHIHPGAAGVVGGVIVNTQLSAAAPMILSDGTGNLIVTNIPMSQTVAAQITENPAGFYFNMHTPSNPGGAIRGQLTRVR